MPETALYIIKRAHLSAKEPYLSAKEPYISARESYRSEVPINVEFGSLRNGVNQKSPTYPKKSHMYAQESPVYLPKRPADQRFQSTLEL